jgi:hypothetical protein
VDELDINDARELVEPDGPHGTVQRAGKDAELAAVVREAVGERLEPIKVLVSELYEAREPPALLLRDMTELLLADTGSPVEPERTDDLAVERAELGAARRIGGS